MLRRGIVTVVVCGCTVLPAAASASSYNPSTQSHPGACSIETATIATAVGDFQRNGVLTDFAHLVGLHGSEGALAGAMKRDLVLGRIAHAVVTENHGCDDVGDWFAVGPRTLTAGELVGFRAPAKLRSRICAGPGKRCKREVLSPHVVFPTNCWNPNFGNAKVAVFVRQPKPKRHKRKPRHRVEPAKESLSPKIKEEPVTVTTTPTPEPAAAPTATAELSCSAGGVVVTISNGATATAAAPFVVNGVSHGPLAAGASETIVIPGTPGSSVTVSVTSGSTVLIAETAIADTCVAAPHASVAYECVVGEQGYPEGEARGVVTVADEASAALPASFELELKLWQGERVEVEEFVWEPVFVTEKATLGPLAPGESATYEFEFAAWEYPPVPQTIKVVSGGKTILERTIQSICIEAG